jgi:negative regulator of sigma E activity
MQKRFKETFINDYKVGAKRELMTIASRKKNEREDEWQCSWLVQGFDGLGNGSMFVARLKFFDPLINNLKNDGACARS